MEGTARFAGIILKTAVPPPWYVNGGDRPAGYTGGTLDNSTVIAETLRDLIAGSFARPREFPSAVDRTITRSRSLRSEERRHFTDLVHDAMRWRRRLWGEIPPSRLDYGDTLKRIQDLSGMAENPPLAKWSSLSMDALAREVSFPTWLLTAWVSDVGFSSAVPLALSFNAPAPTVLRANALRVGRAELLSRLRERGVEATEGVHSPWALRLAKRRNISDLDLFRKGWFEIQDEGSQIAVAELQCLPGQIAVDACAGSGGKALAMAAAMDNRGRIAACDADARSLDELKSRAKRAGASIVESVWVAPDDPNPMSDLEGRADRVFLDAPCSGIGRWRRTPWMKWALSPSEAGASAKKQAVLLCRYARLVNRGGRLAYVTCTLHRDENESVVEGFLRSRADFSILKPSSSLRPNTHGTDGFFIAILERKQV